jgi:hypothetical protein
VRLRTQLTEAGHDAGADTIAWHLHHAATTQVIYATCRLDDEVIAVDAHTGTLTGRAHLSQPTNVTVSGPDIWVSGSAGLTCLNLRLEAQ